MLRKRASRGIACDLRPTILGAAEPNPEHGPEDGKRLAVAPRCRWRKQVCAANNDHSPMTRSQLESLLLRGEATDLDWKRDFPLGLASGSGNSDWEKGRGELLKDIAAIANSLVAGEGHLVLGVRDEGSRRIVVGRSGRWDDADFQTWASNTFDVAPQFRYVEVSWNSEATVGIFIVHTNPGYPHLPKISVGGVLHRVKSGCVAAPKTVSR